jgi:hypothetical protein
MVGVALFLVTYPGEKPYKHRYIWMSNGWLSAPLELLNWIAKTEQEQGCTLELLEWTVEERSDIGY